MKPSWRVVSAGTPVMPRISSDVALAAHLLGEPLAAELAVLLLVVGDDVDVGRVDGLVDGDDLRCRAAWPRRSPSSSAVASAGLMMIAFAPDEIRLRIAAICSRRVAVLVVRRAPWRPAPLASGLRLDRADHLLAPAVADERVADADHVLLVAAARPLPLEPLLDVVVAAAARRDDGDQRERHERPASFLLTCMLLLLGGLWRRDLRCTGDCAAQHPRKRGARARRRRVEQLGRTAGPTTAGLVMTGGSAPRSTSRSAVLTFSFVGQRHGGDRRARTDRGVEARRSPRARRRAACRGRAPRRRGRAGAFRTSARLSLCRGRRRPR